LTFSTLLVWLVVHVLYKSITYSLENNMHVDIHGNQIKQTTVLHQTAF